MNLFLIAFHSLILLPTLINGECKEFYLRMTPEHTGCKHRNDNCLVIKEGLSLKDRKTILVEHNKYRNKIALAHDTYDLPPASNMMKLEWDKELAAIAQSHASQCVFEHDCNLCREVDNFMVGQNLFSKKSAELKVAPAWDEAIGIFYDEIKLITRNLIESYVPDDGVNLYGHFTQLAWAETWKIGCGYTAFRIDEPIYKTEELYTCNYGPAGNIIFGRVYKNGTAGSECPPNTVRSTLYPGLCNAKRNGPQLPVFSDVANVLFLCDFKAKCSLKFSSPDRAHIISLYSGNYLSVRLKKGQNFVITLTEVVSSEDGFCVEFRHRMPSPQSGIKFEVEFYVPEMGWKSDVLAYGINQWVVAKFDVQWNFHTEIRFILTVPKDSNLKYIDLNWIAIVNGHCQR
ncbi:GTx-VA1-like protein [Dinothrombium tinctorium]|uniref:GTx-VA1-like protein n=1 Tax=Dinothrombium tinctorium TaxID=1965070 RepID=A0A3S3QSR5_9ACAR|nr:GTx-VA1-like protein [Dinothrombium tinctorium]